MSTPAQLHHSTPSPRSVASKRRRVTRSCDNCKKKKRRCNGEIPCDLCISQELSCAYEAAYSRGRAPTPKRARLGEPTAPTAQTSRVASPAGDAVGQYLGPTSPFSFLRRACRRFGRGRAEYGHSHDLFDQVPVITSGDRKVPPVDLNHLVLPSRETTAALLDRYFNYAAPTYRFLHEPSAIVWLDRFHSTAEQSVPTASLTSMQEAVVLLVLATASVYDSDPRDGTANWIGTDASPLCEMYFQAGQQRIASEIGRPCLESVQARLLASLLMLNTSRINQAWYTFGTTVQMIFALGLHRARRASASDPDHIAVECQKRCFWSAYQLDAYFCVILGRPPMLNDHDIDQRFPQLVHDEDLTARCIRKSDKPRDCPIAAAILHQKLSGIIKRASRAQNDVRHLQGQQLVDSVAHLNEDIDQWRKDLPVVLSGAVHPSSLVVVFRRQVTVLQVASLHAVILANRPLLLSSTDSDQVQTLVRKCVLTAKEAIEVIKDLMEEFSMFPANWNFQYVAFHALSIIYVWIIQWKHNRVASLGTQLDANDTFTLAQHVQRHLAKVTQSNAPGLRYSIILEELEQEAGNLLRKPDIDLPSVVATTNTQLDTVLTPATDLDGAWEAMSAEFPLDPDLWAQLDYFPFSGEL